MILRNAPADGQAKARAVLLGGEERLKNRARFFRRNARPGVLERDFQAGPARRVGNISVPTVSSPSLPIASTPLNRGS